MTATRGAAFAAAERVIDRVHGDAAHVRLLAQPPVAAGLADRHVLEVEVADLADGGLAVLENLANLTRWHLDRDVVAFLGDDLHGRTGAARELTAVSGLELDVVYQGALRDVGQRQRVPRQDVGGVSGKNRVAHLQAEGLQDVPLLAVGVGDQRDARRPVRVVLDGRDLGRDALLVALEVDHAVEPLVTAAAPPAGELAGVLAAARLAQLLGQRTVGRIRGDLVEHLGGLEPPAGGRGFVLTNRHGRLSVSLGASHSIAALRRSR